MNLLKITKKKVVHFMETPIPHAVDVNPCKLCPALTELRNLLQKASSRKN